MLGSQAEAALLAQLGPASLRTCLTQSPLTLRTYALGLTLAEGGDALHPKLLRDLR